MCSSDLDEQVSELPVVVSLRVVVPAVPVMLPPGETVKVAVTAEAGAAERARAAVAAAAPANRTWVIRVRMLICSSLVDVLSCMRSFRMSGRSFPRRPK